MAASQAVVPVPNNMVINQQPYQHTEIEELTPIPIPVQPDDSGQPPLKKGRESTGKWKGYDSKRVFKKEWEERYGKCYGPAVGEIDVFSARVVIMAAARASGRRPGRQSLR